VVAGSSPPGWVVLKNKIKSKCKNKMRFNI
jgi:hypothetical protein